jgi:FkbM family methyltransferase
MFPRQHQLEASGVKKLLKGLQLTRHPRAWSALANTRTAAAIEHLQVLRDVRADTIIDVGANKGQFSVAARIVNPHVKIVAFEPLDSEARIFEKNHRRSRGVELHRCALSKVEGQADFYVPRRADSSSLRQPTQQASFAYGVSAKYVIRVETRRLDQILAPLALVGCVLLKIDVQGAEGEVIEGAVGILSQVRFIYVEASFVELYAGQLLASGLASLLDALGFELRGVYNMSRTPQFGATQADFLFVNRLSAGSGPCAPLA